MHGGFSPPPRAPGAGVPRTSPAAVRLSSVNRETDELCPPRRQHRSFTKRSGLHAERATRHKGSVRLSGARHATCRRGVPGTFARAAAANGVSDGRPAALSPGLRGGGRGLGAAGRRVVPAGRAQAPPAAAGTGRSDRGRQQRALCGRVCAWHLPLLLRSHAAREAWSFPTGAAWVPGGLVPGRLAEALAAPGSTARPR